MPRDAFIPMAGVAEFTMVFGLLWTHGSMTEGMQHRDPDAAFMQGMIPHHQGAIDMAEVVLDMAVIARCARWPSM